MLLYILKNDNNHASMIYISKKLAEANCEKLNESDLGWYINVRSTIDEPSSDAIMTEEEHNSTTTAQQAEIIKKFADTLQTQTAAMPAEFSKILSENEDCLYE